jgi:hypothetical protein
MGTTPDTDEDGSEFTGDAQQHLVGGVGKPQQAIVIDDMMTVMVVAILEICCPMSRAYSTPPPRLQPLKLADCALTIGATKWSWILIRAQPPRR